MTHSGVPATKAPGRTYRETRFRQPTEAERAIGVWVDRIGEGRGSAAEPRFRVLGQYAAVMVEEGHGHWSVLGAGDETLAAGDVALIGPDEPTRYGTADAWYTRWIVWNGPEAATWRQWLRGPGPIVRGGARPVRLAHLRLAGLMSAPGVAAALARKAVLLDMILELNRIGARGTTATPSESAVRATMDVMAAQCERPWSVAALARQAGLSVSQYRRIFRQCAGASPSGFLRAARMARAKELLLAGESIKCVAAQTGYDDVFYFMRAFRQAAGMPPGRFARLDGWRAETATHRGQRLIN